MTSASNPRSQSSRFDSLASQRSTSSHLQLDERVSSLRDRLEARADLRAAENLRADVREARGHVKNWEPRKAVNENTAARYERIVGGMKHAGQRPEDAACRATYEQRRAALVHVTRTELKAALTDLDRAKRSGDLSGAADAYSRVQVGLDTLRRYPPTTGSRELDRQRTSAYVGPNQAAADRSNGKRASISDLPDGWRDDVQRAARPADRVGIAAMSLTGCRPTEVRGIKVTQDADSVTLSIRSAKFDDDRGIKARAVTLSKAELQETQAGRDLQEWLGAREVRTVAHTGSVEAFRERVGRAAARAGYDDVSAYSFRHATARELREEGADRDEIANRLGHRALRSQSAYG